MKCREASGLIHRYLENKLEAADKALLERHFEGCTQCRSELRLIGRLQDERLHEMRTKAPEGFTDSVMAALNRLPPERRPCRTAAPDDRWKLMYRRLGYSLILTAGIIMFAVFMPAAGLHPEAISGKVQTSVESSEPGYRGVFENIDAGIMGIFKDLAGPAQQNKGGMGNGM